MDGLIIRGQTPYQKRLNRNHAMSRNPAILFSVAGYTNNYMKDGQIGFPSLSDRQIRQ
jgi:hypothetical protein